MLIKRVHPVTQVLHEREIPVTEAQMQDWLGGTLIQNAMPNLSADALEFIKTGLLPSDFDPDHEDGPDV